MLTQMYYEIRLLLKTNELDKGLFTFEAIMETNEDGSDPFVLQCIEEDGEYVFSFKGLDGVPIEDVRYSINTSELISGDDTMFLAQLFEYDFSPSRIENVKRIR